MHSHRAHRTAAIFAVAAFATGGLLAACGESTTEAGPDPIPFEGSLVNPPDFPDFFGNVWINAGTEAIGISVAFQGEPDPVAGFDWVLREGSCAAAGAVIGSPDDYPTIALDGEGTWSGTVDVSIFDASAVAMEIEFVPAGGEGDGQPVELGCVTLTRSG